MVQVINDPYNGNVFGRIGKGIGQSLSEQVPKEVERGRLSSGLKKLEQEKDLDPFQFFTRAATLPGMNPQLIETLGKLSKQRLQGQALSKEGGAGKVSRFPETTRQENGSAKDNNIPSLTTRNPLDATLEPYIPMSRAQINQKAAELFNDNPALYNNDPQLAIQAAKEEDAQEQAINATQQNQRINEQNVQNTLTSALRNQHNLLQNNVPAEIYSKIEDEAIRSVKSVKNGGRGLTEQQAAKEYGDKLAEISKDYTSLDALGKYTLMGKKPKETAEAIKSLQTKAAKRHEQEQFASTLTTKNGLSPQFAYSLAYPVEGNKPLYADLSKLSPITNNPYRYEAPQEQKKANYDKTYSLSPNLAQKIGDGSPLAIAEYLQNKGYDPSAFMDYVRAHREELDLTERQGRELDKATSFIPPLNDLYLRTFGGVK